MQPRYSDIRERCSRILVLGCSGSGKTTLAMELASALELPHTELDALYHLHDWTPNPEFKQQVRNHAAQDRWVIDGNYSSQVAEILWPRAELILWLDYDRGLIMRRLLARTARRIMKRSMLWNGNRESIRKLFERDNVLVWSWNSHPRYRAEFPLLLKQHARCSIVTFANPSELDEWLRT